VVPAVHRVAGAAQIGEALEFLQRHDASVGRPDTRGLSLLIEPI
jgi:hypothetical protein